MQRTLNRQVRWTLATPLAAALFAAACGTEPDAKKTEVTTTTPPPQFVVDVGGVFDFSGFSSPAPACPNIVAPAAADGCARIDGALVTFGGSAQVGTGNINPFLQIQDSPSEEAYNTSTTQTLDMGSSPQFNHDVALSRIPVIKLSDGVLYREIVMDANESNATNDNDRFFSIDVMEVYLMAGTLKTPDGNPSGQMALPPTSLTDLRTRGVLVWDMKVGADVKKILGTDAFSKGSGNGSDFQFFIPEQKFADAIGQIQVQSCPYQGPDAPVCGYWVVVYSELGKTGGNFITNATFEEYATVERGFVNVSKTATANFTRQYKWKISKVADPTAVNIFTGDKQDVGYTVKVEPDGSTDKAYVISGTVTIDNPSNEAVSIEEPTDELSGPISVPLECTDEGDDVVIDTWPHAIAGGDAVVCTYSYNFGDTAPSGVTNTASVELVDGAVVQKTVSVVVAANPTTTVDDTYTLSDDKQGDLGPGGLPDGTTDTYTRTFACDANKGENKNTATFTTDDTQTTGSADATVTVTCYDLTVTKDATTAFTRSFTWTIDKIADPIIADPSSLTLAVGETYLYNYKVTVDTTGYTDSGFGASGNIHVKNNHPSKVAVINGVEDVIEGPISATVTCTGITFPYDLAAGATLDCTYSATLTDGTDLENTATAEQQNQHYNAAGAVIVDATMGTTDYSGTADIDFGAPTTLVDECIDVTDDKYGALGQVCAVDAPKSFNYSFLIGPYEVCGNYTFTNTASFVTTDDANDTDASGSDDHTVSISVPCVGCTLTQGYWKTHNATFKASKNGKGPAADDNWLNVTPFAEQSGFFTTSNSFPVVGPNTPSPTASGVPANAFDWYLVFWTAPAGNVYYNLAHQYEAAKLNVLNGVTPSSAVATAIASAEDLLDSYGPAYAAGLKGAAKNVWVNLAGILGSFNEGAAGTSHCSEDIVSRLAGAK